MGFILDRGGTNLFVCFFFQKNFGGFNIVELGMVQYVPLFAFGVL
jgi:hypothetical protein